MLVTEHNLTFYQQLMQAMREAIATGGFAVFAAQFRRSYRAAGVKAWGLHCSSGARRSRRR